MTQLISNFTKLHNKNVTVSINTVINHSLFVRIIIEITGLS